MIRFQQNILLEYQEVNEKVDDADYNLFVERNECIPKMYDEIIFSTSPTPFFVVVYKFPAAVVRQQKSRVDKKNEKV